MRVAIGTFEATPRMIDRVVRVLRSGRLSYGPESKELEQEFALLHDSLYGVLSNSGTSSLVVALQALKELYGWPDGSEVIVPAITFVATVNAVLQCRMVPVLVDVEPQYYDLNPRKIAGAVTDKTVACIAVNVFGKPADLLEISRACWENGKLTLIEDSCEAMLVEISGRKVGSVGKVGVFSFYMAHLLTAGVGGIGITEDYEIARKMRSLVNHGISVENLPGPDRYDPAFLGRNFEFDSIGHSFRITELEAAIALEELNRLYSIVDKRNAVAVYYDRLLSGFADKMQLPEVRPNSRSSWMMYPIVMRFQGKHEIMGWLRRADIEVRDMLPLTTQPCYKGMFNPSDYPVAQWINESGFYIGCHPGINHEQQEYVADVIYEYWRNHEDK